LAPTHTTIELSATRLAVQWPGRGTGSLQRPFKPGEWERIWSGDRSFFSDMVRSLLNDAAIQCGRATVFYQSPTLVCGLFSCPAQVRDVTSAARMALADIATMDLTNNPWCVQPLARDRNGEPRRRHIAMAADTDECVSRLTDVFLNAGLAGVDTVPMETALTASTVDHALNASAKGRSIVSVHFGQTRSVIIAAHDHRLLLARPVDFGTDRLIEALSHSISSAEDSRPAEDIAQALLFQHGLPTPGQTIDIGSHSLEAADILPAIQPVLQRMLVEIRQSVRFGLSDLSEKPIVLLCGSGANIPRLSEAFTAELGSECIADQTVSSIELSDLTHAQEALRNGLRVRLIPRRDAAAGSVRSLRNALYAGSAAALVLGAGHTAMVMHQEEQLRPQVDALLAQTQPASHQSLDPLKTANRVRAVRATIEAIDTALGERSDIASLLQELCVLTAETAILTDIEFSGSRNAECRLRGYTRAEAADPGSSVRLLIDSLRSSPLIESVRLDGTQTSVLDNHETQYFSATLKLRTVPHPITSPSATVASVPVETQP